MQHLLQFHNLAVSRHLLASPVFVMRWFTVATLIACLSSTLFAHHPDKENYPVHPRIDLIGPLGNWLPPSYRRRYNRPSNVAGKISYYIAPSSLEAMSWHASKHRNAYKDHKPRTVMHYFYPKPWEAIKIGPRVDTVNMKEINETPSALPAFQADETLQDVIQKEDGILEKLRQTPEEGASPSDQPLRPADANSNDPVQQLIEGDKIPQPIIAPNTGK